MASRNAWVYGASLFSLNFCFVLLLSSCVGMTKEACLQTDWHATGYEDGAAGQPISAVSSKRRVCAKRADPTVNMAQYGIGRQEGLTQYCRPSRGYTLGSSGKYYDGVCAGFSEADFLTAYEAGRRLYKMERAITRVSTDIRQARYDRNEIEFRLVRTKTALIATNIPGVNRANLLIELKQLLHEKSRIESTLANLENNQARSKDDMDEYRKQMALNGPLPRTAAAPVSVNY